MLRGVDATQPKELAAEIRPGVFRPDWSAARSLAARQALAGRAVPREGLLDKWMLALQPEHDRVWQAVLTLYGSGGQPPTISELANHTGLSEALIADALRVLDERDLLKLSSGDAILYAYPFSQYWTGHTVSLGSRELASLCAIDALGAGAMFGADVTVRSTCRHCGDPISVITTERGRALDEINPTGAAVWYDFTCGGDAASCCCPSIAFFCSEAHLQEWLAQAPGQLGIQLTVSEALEVGRAIFGPVLQRAST